MMTFTCPICQKPLLDGGKSLACKNGHNFDRAKSGYVNLLPPNSKHSKLPGDNKLMVDARKNFLERGYYQPLCDALCTQVKEAMKALPSPVIMDAGCGEGYYTSRVQQALSEVCKPQVFGVDISKFALNSAAKQNKEICYGVGSIFHLPIKERSCDVVLNLFAPYCGEEFQRVLKPDGSLFLIIPGAEHLWGLKQAVYDQPYRNEVKDYALEGFRLLHRQAVSQTIRLTCQEDIQNLFMMTPYYYKTSKEGAARVQALDKLETLIQFEILHYKLA